MSDTNGTAVGKSLNATEAPTNAATLESIKPQGITEEELDFITLVDQYWGVNGELLSADKANEEWGIKQNRYTELLNKSHVKLALEERGVDVRRYSIDLNDTGAWRTKGLTPLQLLVANTLLDLTDQRSDKKKLQDYSVSTRTYMAWLRDPVFSGYLRERAEALLGDSHHEAILALLDKVKSGDIKAIELHLELTGRYTRKVVDSGTASQIDFQALMVRLVEIIDEECDGPTAMRIAARMKRATAAQMVATDLLTGEIVVPEIMPMKELTPELQELKDRTGGNT